MAVKEHLQKPEALSMDGRWGKMLAVVATKLGREVSCEFLPAHSLVLLTYADP